MVPRTGLTDYARRCNQRHIGPIRGYVPPPLTPLVRSAGICPLPSRHWRVLQALPDGAGLRWCGACMLAPPNRGSMISRRLASLPLIGPLFRILCGPAAVELGSLPHETDAMCVTHP